MEELFKIIFGSNSKINPQLRDHLEKLLEYRVYKKGEFLCREGQICRRVFFIVSGLVQHYTSDGNKENTTWILKENDIATSVKSYFKQIPSLEFLQALETTSTYSITLDQLNDTIEKFPEFGAVKFNILLNYYEILHDRFSVLSGSKPEQNYNWLMANSPDLSTRAPKKSLSSYLLMSVKKLSDLRDGKKQNRKKK